MGVNWQFIDEIIELASAFWSGELVQESVDYSMWYECLLNVRGFVIVGRLSGL